MSYDYETTNVYEGPIRQFDKQNKVVRTGMLPSIPNTNRNLPETSQITKVVREDKSQRGFDKKEKILLGCSLAFMTLLLVTIMVQNITAKAHIICPDSSQKLSPEYQQSTVQNALVASSCLELSLNETKDDGIYLLKTKQGYVEAFCDMTTSDGGWTLVASIHEKNITEKCDADDNWSIHTHDSSINGGRTNWENDFEFGTVRKCTEDDYKNEFYYSLNASDVMVWHVQSGVSTSTTKKTATARYRTYDGFLGENGGNFKALFQKYPLEIKIERRAEDILAAIANRSSEITSMSNWYNYSSFISIYYVRDRSMYSNDGSRIQFYSPHKSVGSVHYGTKHSFWRSRTEIMAGNTSPITFVSVILNEDRESQYFQIQVRSSRADSSEQISEFQNTITVGNYKLQYKAIQMYSLSYSTPCELFFVVSNVKDWKSVEPSAFTLEQNYKSRTTRYHQYKIDGYPSKILFGYMLLARQARYNFATTQADEVAKTILKAVASVKNLFNPNRNDSLTVPVTFDKGGTTTMMNMIPPKHRSSVEGGYIQFRPFNYTGYPNAFCPGLKVNMNSPELACVGGVSTNVGPHGTCGDFAGWEGKQGDIPLPMYSHGNAHSEKDISSTILIFYR